MRKLLALVAVVGLVSVAACKKDEAKPETAPAETVTGTVKPGEVKPNEVKPDEAKPDEAQEMTNKMVHCPSSVEGALTAVSAGEDSIILTVTAKDEAATTEIRKRATHLASLNDADSTEVTHSGNGTGGGALGKCPVALGQGKVTAADSEGGTTITMTPKTPGGLAELNAMVRDRASAMAAGAGHEHGTGGGAGEHKGDGTGGGGGGGTGGGNDAKEPAGKVDPASKSPSKAIKGPELKAPPVKAPVPKVPAVKAPPAVKKRGIDAGA